MVAAATAATGLVAVRGNRTMSMTWIMLLLTAILLMGGGKRGGTAAEVEFVGMGGWADNQEEAIDLEGVASACRHLLARAPPGHQGGGGEGRGRSSILLFVTRMCIRCDTCGCNDVASSGWVLMLSSTTEWNGDCSFGPLCPSRLGH